MTETMTVAQLKALTAKPKRKGKFNNTPTWVDGRRFDSKKEAEYYIKRLKDAHLISDVKFQERFDIIMMGVKCAYYKADFSFNDWSAEYKGKRRIVDVKGIDTSLSKLKRKLVEAQYGIRIELA